MNEAKKKYLESLSKQIDPKVLEKMMQHFAGDGSESPQPESSSIPASSASALSAVEQIKKMRNSRFQDMLARMRIENTVADTHKKEEPIIDWCILILSNLNIWTRIVDNQFKNIGFTQSKYFSDFASLMKYITKSLNEGTLVEFAVAVPLQEISDFIKAWEYLKRGIKVEQKMQFLDDIPFFFIVESPRQINEKLVARYGIDRFICLSDDTNINSEKVENILTAKKRICKGENNENSDC